MYFNYHKRSYRVGENPYRAFRLNVYSQEPFPQTQLAKVCKSIALDWGEVHHQKTLLSLDNLRVTHFSCSGHGGRVVFSGKRIKAFDKLLNLSHNSYRNYNAREFYIYTLEEDCEWALLPLLALEYPIEEVRKAIQKDFKQTTHKDFVSYLTTSIETVYYSCPSYMEEFNDVLMKLFPNEFVAAYSKNAKSIQQCKKKGLERLSK